MARALRCLPMLLFVYMIAGCAMQESAMRVASAAGWKSVTVPVTGLPLRAFAQQPERSAGALLHVYLGGDGRPWHHGRYPAEDPSGRNPLVLELMRADSGPALYLGRPCYHDLANRPGCEARLWTSARYSEQVVDNMARALETLLEQWRPRAVLLVGYSGGGVLALALSARLSLPAYVVTLGANLDVGAWTDYHAYLPLTESLDPARDTERYRVIPQLHLQGRQDRVVPPETTRRYTAALPAGAVRTLQGADHRCCWLPVWKSLLREAPWNNALPPEAAAPGSASVVSE